MTLERPSVGGRSKPWVANGDRLAEIGARVEAAGVTNIVLDDDPTGTQSISDVPLLTTWTDDDLRWALTHPSPTVFVLTNTRAMGSAMARAINVALAGGLERASVATGRPFVLTSRSDSTLRGHFPVETDALQEGLREAGALPIDGVIVCPGFFEARRLTIDNIHWVDEGGELVPVGSTAYARDRSFGFASSDLRDWIAERTGGRVASEQVASIAIEEIRAGGPDVVRDRLRDVSDGSFVIVNAEDAGDLEIFVLGLMAAENAGKRFLYRTGPSFPRIRGGIDGPRLLDRRKLFGRGPTVGRGLVLVGSHVPATTRQLAAAADLPQTKALELSVARLLGEARDDEIARVRALVAQALREAGTDVIVYTSRHVVTSDQGGADANLGIARAVSHAIVELVRGIDLKRVAWLIAKGGITASDIGTEALGVRRATVLGPLLAPGIVAVWLLPDESAAPGMPFVIFPGNVGDDHALADAILALREAAQSA